MRGRLAARAGTLPGRRKAATAIDRDQKCQPPFASDFRPRHDHGLALKFRAIGADPEHIRHHLLGQRLGRRALRHQAAFRQHQHWSANRAASPRSCVTTITSTPLSAVARKFFMTSIW